MIKKIILMVLLLSTLVWAGDHHRYSTPHDNYRAFKHHQPHQRYYYNNGAWFLLGATIGGAIVNSYNPPTTQYETYTVERYSPPRNPELVKVRYYDMAGNLIEERYEER